MKIRPETALTFDDVLLEPGYISFPESQIDLSTQLTSAIKLDKPLVTAPMDRVTEVRMAMAIAQMGGIGIIHRYMTPEDQAKEVSKVKDAGLLVGAAIGTKPGYEDRAARLVEAGVDVLVLDQAQGFSSFMVEALEQIKRRYEVGAIAGNIATARAANLLIDAGADALRAGVGPGAICTTRLVTGMGVPQLTAVMNVAEAARRHNIPVIADGGINYSGDIVKAQAAGASTVMLGRLMAAAEESPGEIIDIKAKDVPDRFKNKDTDPEAMLRFKPYRGMGSIGAMRKAAEARSEEEFHGKDLTVDRLVAEGVEALVPYAGPVEEVVNQLMGGIRRGYQDIGARNVSELYDLAIFQRVTHASLVESHPHDVWVLNDAA
ncbi:MAG TPA: IMP dehydrogenase [Candidatus Saccharimonadales bacterium]|nr:IMP dehydrogenase [Candidatus Saccharimonadales bacterium]